MGMPAVWQVVALAFLFWLLTKILDALEKLGKQIENVRFYLGQIEERLQRTEGNIHRIESHTHRAVSDAYERDEWSDRGPPL